MAIITSPSNTAYALGQQQVRDLSSPSGFSQNTFTTTAASTPNFVVVGEQLRRAAVGSPAQGVQASLPKTLQAELQEEVDAWLPEI